MNNDHTPETPLSGGLATNVPALPPDALDFVHRAHARLLDKCPQAKAWMCDVSMGCLPAGEQAQSWRGQTIPFLSIRAFRSLEIRQIEAADVAVCFRSSGSTAGGASSRGQHCLGQGGLASYAHAALHGYLEFLKRLKLTAETTTLVTMIPPQSEWQASSLAAMFELLASSGIHVIWSSPESIIRDLGTLRLKLASAPTPSKDPALGCSHSVIVFGTSLHHHIAHTLSSKAKEADALQPDAAADLFNVICAVDTGGAKGKTIVLNESEMDQLLRKTYAAVPCKEFVTASQYGMCELASQAWSKSNLLREFIAAPTLIPIVVDPKTFTPADAGKAGLLAFIDLGNVDSYPAILTEDYGVLVHNENNDSQGWMPGGTFRLLGRAPMASIKGCSLRVQDLGFASLPMAAKNRAQPLHTGMRDAGVFLPLGQSTAKSAWDSLPDCFTQREKKLLVCALESCPTLKRSPGVAVESSISAKHATKKLIIIASANVAITFLFPVLAALANGFTQVDLVLPSVRDDDPLAKVIAQQIDWILAGLHQAAAPHGMHVYSHRELPRRGELETYHTMVVFGSNETVDLFERTYGNGPMRILGFGDICNTLVLRTCNGTGNTLIPPQDLAELCMAWRGRGCLTPRLIVTEDTMHVEDYLDVFRSAYHQIFAEEFTQVEQELLALFHWHSALEVRALFGENAYIHRATGSTIVDLRRVDSTQLAKALNLSLAGQGLLFVINESQYACLEQSGLHTLQSLPVAPRFHDKHQGRTWTDWLSE